jgi:hypothetical protein
MEMSLDPRLTGDHDSLAPDRLLEMYWTWLSRHLTRARRKCVGRKLREPIFRMVTEKPTWEAPRVHGELKMLGLNISERTVLRWMRIASKNPEPARRWVSFLCNHRQTIAAIDFFTTRRNN